MPFALWLFFRTWDSIWALIAAQVLPVNSNGAVFYQEVPRIKGGLDFLWIPWQRWDTGWYMNIANQGYSVHDLSAAFFPFYPLLIRLVEPLLADNGVAAAVLIASVAALISLVLFYQLAVSELGEQGAERALLYLVTFPTAFFLFAGYTESLFLALMLGAFLCARRQYWGWAGLVGGLSGLVRPQGMLMLLPLGIEFWLQYRRGQVNWKGALNLLPVVIGGFAFWTYLGILSGDWLAGLQVQVWWRHSTLPWDALGQALRMILDMNASTERFFGVPDFVIGLLFLGLLLLSVFRLSPTWTSVIVIIVLPPLFGVTINNPYLPLSSLSRYVLVAFPAFLLLGRFLTNRVLRGLFVCLSLLLQTLWLMLFASFMFVG
ncbi:MAG: hypothetical protein WCF84_14330 [Anaerolineae bacterium]